MNKLLRISLTIVIMTMATFALILLAGDEDPLAPLSLSTWLLLKGIGLALGVGAGVLGYWIDRHLGLFD